MALDTTDIKSLHELLTNFCKLKAKDWISMRNEPNLVKIMLNEYLSTTTAVHSTVSYSWYIFPMENNLSNDPCWIKDLYLTGTSIIKYDFSLSDQPRYGYCNAYSWKAFRRKMTSIIAPHIQNSRWTICHKSCSASKMTEMKDVDGLEQNCSISIANAMEILQSYTKPLMCWWNACPNFTPNPPNKYRSHITSIFLQQHNHKVYVVCGHSRDNHTHRPLHANVCQ